jgi:predicted HTH transcriptional regulator
LSPEVRGSLNDDERASLEFISGQQLVVSRDLMEKFGFDERKAQRVFKKLLESGLVRRVGKGPSTSYQLIQP